MPDVDDKRTLDLAARAALRGLGLVEPNPCVGCVLVDGAGRVASIGHHRRFGGAHAEVEAVRACRALGRDPRGMVVYCTLEPCGHTGKTGPCADMLIEAGVSRVVCARREPTSLAGGGAARLRAAGIDVRFTDVSPLATLAGAAHAKRTDEGLPWVIAKWAQSRDGYVAARGGEPRWLSNRYSRRQVHVLRGRVDAVVVGVGTVLGDDPILTARGVATRRLARRVVLDTNLRTPPDSKLVRSIGAACSGGLTVFADRAVVERDGERVGALRSAGAEVVGVGSRAGRVDVRAALAELVSRHDATRVLIEPGPTLLGSLLGEGLVDEARVYVGPMELGGDGSVRAVEGGLEASLAPLELWRERTLAGDRVLTFGARGAVSLEGDRST